MKAILKFLWLGICLFMLLLTINAFSRGSLLSALFFFVWSYLFWRYFRRVGNKQAD